MDKKDLKLRKPLRPYRNVGHAVEILGIFGAWKNRTKANWFPCLECFGKGRIVHPDEERDPVEGHKMSRRIECSKCNGSGESRQKEFMAYYNKRIKEWKEKLEQWKKDTKTLEKTKKKLTVNELDILLRVLGRI